jgi:CxxC motif-containing protein
MTYKIVRGNNMVSQVICNRCSSKCVIDIYKSGNEYKYDGSMCDQGIVYGEEYMRSNERIFTSVVRVKGITSCSVVPVKSNKPLDINLWIECSKALSRVYVGIPIKIGDVICKNILNSGVDIICTKNIEKNS